MSRATPSRARPHRRVLRIATAGLVVAVVMCAAALGAYLSSARWLDHTLEVRHESYEWLTAVLDADATSRAYVALGRPEAEEGFDAAVATAKAKLSLVRALVVDNGRQERNVEAAERDSQALFDDLHDLMALTRAGRRDEALARLASAQTIHATDAVRADVALIRAEEERLLVERRDTARTRGVALLGAAAVLALGGFGLLVLTWRREGEHRRVVSAMETEARGRLTALSELAEALSEARTRSEVARVVVDHGRRAAGADTCTLYLLDDAGDGLDLVADVGVVPEVLDKIPTDRREHRQPGDVRVVSCRYRGLGRGRVGVRPEVPDAREREGRGPTRPGILERSPRGGGQAARPAGRRVLRAAEVLGRRAGVRRDAGRHCAQALLRAARLEGEEEARQWFTTTLRSIGDAVIATDAEGRVTFMNPVAEALTGWSEADARGRPLDEVFCIFSEQTRAAVESPVTKVLREGKIVGLANHTVLAPDAAREIPIDDSGAPIRNEAGRIIGVVLVFRDVTHEKRERARSEFLAKAGEALVASIDYAVDARDGGAPGGSDARRLVRRRARRAGRRRTRSQVAVAHVDEHKVRFARELGERYPPDPNATHAASPRSSARDARSSTPRSRQALLEAAAVDEEHLRMIRELAPQLRHGRPARACEVAPSGP